MMLWTFQPHGLIQHDISVRGSYHALSSLSSFHDEPSFMNAYAWMVNAMNRHHVMKSKTLKHDRSITPIWLYARWKGHGGTILSGTNDIVAIRREHDFDWAENMDLIVLNIPPARVLLTDFDGWHAVLNAIPFMNDEEWEHVDDACMDAHASDAHMRNTWERIIIHPSSIGKHDYVQATTWSIRKSDVVAVIPPIM